MKIAVVRQIFLVLFVLIHPLTCTHRFAYFTWVNINAAWDIQLTLVTFKQNWLEGQEPDFMSTFKFEVLQLFTCNLKMCWTLKLDNCWLKRLWGISLDLYIAIDMELVKSLFELSCLSSLWYIVKIAEQLERGLIRFRLEAQLRIGWKWGCEWLVHEI